MTDRIPTTERIRAHFPALSRRVGGRPAAFFDGPAGSQVPLPVIDAVADYLAYRNANTAGLFATSRESDETIAMARQRLADFLGARSAGEIVFGQNMTTLTYAFSRALRRTWTAGDEVIVTDLDHQANIAPWVAAARESGATVRVVPFDPETCTLDLGALESFLGPRTRLVAVGYASNAVGTVSDVQRVAALAREAGALSYVDAVHFAPHGAIAVEEIGCDFLVCSAYKFFGPHLGVLWGRRELLETLTPYKVPPAVDAVPQRWETGTLCHEAIAGAAAAVEWIASLGPRVERAGWRERMLRGMRAVEALEEPLFARMLAGAAEIPGVRVYGPPAGRPRTPTLAFTLRGYTAQEVAERLGREAIFVWDGDFYASNVIDRLGVREVGGVVRAGLAPYNTPEEVERLLEALRRLPTRE